MTQAPEPVTQPSAHTSALVLKRLAEHARRQPQRAAIEEDGRQLTYAGLHEGTGQMAAILRAHPDFQTQQPVGILTGNYIDAAVAINGALQSGGIAVPLAASHPTALLKNIIADAGIRIVLGDRDLYPELAETAPVAWIHPATSAQAQADTAEAPLEVDPDWLSSITFSSGTTGTPKGITERHRNLTHHIDLVEAHMPLSGFSRVGTILPHHFGAGYFNLFHTLSVGATLTHYDFARGGLVAFFKWLNQTRPEVIALTPSLLRSLLRTTSADTDYSLLKMVRLSGEPLLRRDILGFREAFPDTTLLFNAYGITENRVVAVNRIGPDQELPEGVVGVGQLLEPHAIRLEADGQVVTEDDTAGEIIIESDFVTPGYWKGGQLVQPAERFSGPGGRIFRTGDRGFLRNGCLHLTGRSDQMVKINGTQVDVLAVQDAIASVDGVAETCVLTTTVDDVPQLLGFFVRRPHRPATVDAVRDELNRLLPAPMVPGELFGVDALPVNANQKLDRKALLETAVKLRQTRRVSPPGEEFSIMDQRLNEIWQDVLRKPGHIFSKHDNFFKVGGDSLAASELLLQIHRVFDVQLEPESLVADPSIFGISRSIENPVNRGHDHVRALKRSGDRPRLYCIPGAGTNASIFVTFARMFNDAQPIYGFDPIIEARKPGYPVARYLSVETIARRYVEELLKQEPQDEVRLYGFSFGGTIAVEMAHQLEQRGQRVSGIVLGDTFAPGYPDVRPGLSPVARLKVPLYGLLPLGTNATLNKTNLRKGIRQRFGPVKRNLLYNFQKPRPGEAADWDHEFKQMQANRKHTPKPIDTPVLLLSGRDNSLNEELFIKDAALGWKPYLKNLQVKELSGNHLTLVTENLPEIARCVEAFFEESR